LWQFQAGYRWNGLAREPNPDWDDDWLVVASEGVGLVYNAVAGLSAGLGKQGKGSHVRTTRWNFLSRPGMIFGSPTTLIVQLGPFGAMRR
jgi:hypothetical protein